MPIITAFMNNRHSKGTGDSQVFAEELIRSLQTPCTEAEVSRINRMIEVEAAQLDETCRHEARTEMEAARLNHSRRRKEAQDHRLSVERRKSEFEKAESNRGSFILMLIAITFFCSCMVAEWDITWETLPYVLSVKKYSFTGVMLSLAPVTGLAILKVAFAILVWEPYQKARSEVSASPRKAPRIVMAVFLIAVGAFTLITLAKVAEARSEIGRLKEQARIESRTGAGESDKKVAADWNKINRAVYIVSICLAINGAIFFLIGLTELNRITAYVRSLVLLVSLRNWQRWLESGAARAETHLVEKTNAWENIDERAKNSAEYYRQRLSLILEQALKRPRKAQSYRELVAERLAANL